MLLAGLAAPLSAVSAVLAAGGRPWLLAAVALAAPLTLVALLAALSYPVAHPPRATA
jgi:hypothetical protein